MAVTATTHLNFRGNARDALCFYADVFGGGAVIVTYDEAGAAQDPADVGQVLWGQVVTDSGFRVMAYDVPTRLPWNPGETAFFVSVRSDSAAEIEAYWARLIEGGTIVQELAPSAWAPLYGMARDRFGITWVLDVEGAAAAPA